MSKDHSRITHRRQLVYDSFTCPKRLFSYIKRSTECSDGIHPLQSREHSDKLVESDLAQAETLRNYFRGVYSTSSVNDASHNHTTETLATGSVRVTKEAVL